MPGMEMGLPQIVILLAAGFAAGAINAIAGGGSLVSFPALVFLGLPTKAANVTNTVALWPGYLGGSLAYRSEISVQRRRLLLLLLPTLIGATLGSVILLYTPTTAFDRIVPFLILFACGLMAFQDRLARFAVKHRLTSEDEGQSHWLVWISILLLAVYGAYFGAGLGILTLAVLAILLPDDFQRSNALKGILSFLTNGLAVVYFALFGPVAWLPALVVAVSAIVGGYLGVAIARWLPKQWIRVLVIGYGVIVAAVLLYRAFF